MAWNSRPVRNTIANKHYPSIMAAVDETGCSPNTIRYWLNKSMSGKPSDWEYLDASSSIKS